MARPRIFDEDRKGINIYLHKEQYDWLKKYCHSKKMSPSKFMREYLDMCTTFLPEYLDDKRKSFTRS